MENGIIFIEIGVISKEKEVSINTDYLPFLTKKTLRQYGIKNYVTI